MGRSGLRKRQREREKQEIYKEDRDHAREKNSNPQSYTSYQKTSFRIGG